MLSTETQKRLSIILGDLTEELQRQGLWQQSPPPPQLLASQLPFCIDTLEFHQWLQFVFIDRLQMIMSSGAELPAGCSVSPMAEEVWRDKASKMAGIIGLLAECDELLSG